MTKLSAKSVKIDHNTKETEYRQSSERRNKDDILGDKASTPDVDNTKVVDNFNQTKPQETIYVNQELRKENCSECAQMTIGPREFPSKLVSEFNTSNGSGHIQCNVCQELFSTKKDLIVHVVNTHDAVKHMEQKLGLKTCLNVRHKYQ